MRAFSVQQPLFVENAPVVLSRKWVVVYVVLQSLLIAVQLTALVLPRWYRYCWWDFGVLFASSFTGIGAYEGELTIEDVHSDACGERQDYTEANCSDLCSNTDNFKTAGGLMLGAGMISVLFGVALVLVHLIKHYRPEFKFNFIVLLGILQSFFYCLGVTLFYFISQLPSLTVDSQGITGSSAPAQMTLEEGFIMSLTACGLAVLLVVFSYFKTSKGFKKWGQLN